MGGKIKVALLAVVVLIIAALVSFITVVTVAGYNNRVFPGVAVEGIELSDMTEAAAVKTVENFASFFYGKTIEVRFSSGSGSFNLSDINYKVDTASTVKKAMSVGRRGNFIEQWRERQTAAKQGIVSPLEFSFSKEKLKSVLDNMTKSVRKPPSDAKLNITPTDTVEILKSSGGTGVDFESAVQSFNSIIKENKVLTGIELKLVELKPQKTTQDMEKLRITGLLSSYTSRFDPNKVNRTYNIRVAAGVLNGLVIKPGEVFSFNKIVGPRSEEAGYKTAKIVINSEFIDGLGGGVCQVSSTLYNTLLRANIDVIQRSNHSLVITYVPLGQDAAVAFGAKDLKFKNNLPCSLIVRTSVGKNTITIKLFGDMSLKNTVAISNRVVKTYPFKIVYQDDPTLPAGKQVVSQKGANGYSVVSRMTVYQGKTVVVRKNLPSSRYNPLDQIVMVGRALGDKKPVNKVQNGSTTVPVIPNSIDPGAVTNPPIPTTEPEVVPSDPIVLPDPTVPSDPPTPTVPTDSPDPTVPENVQ
jgi:vancomycin resistance protein YoaR